MVTVLEDTPLSCVQPPLAALFINVLQSDTRLELARNQNFLACYGFALFAVQLPYISLLEVEVALRGKCYIRTKEKLTRNLLKLCSFKLRHMGFAEFWSRESIPTA